MELRPGYKQTEVGVIPEDWEVKKISDLQPIVTSGSRGWAAFYSDRGAPFIRITNLSRSSIYLNLEDLRLVNLPKNASEGTRTQLQDNDVLVSITADIGIIGYVSAKVPKPAYINQHIALVRLDPAQTNSKFVSYFLASERPQKLFRALTDSGAKAGMNLTTVQQIPLALPPTLAEQEAIAEALSDADALIESLEQLIAKKRQIKQGAMQELLIGKKRLPGFATKPGYKQTEVGMIPKDWEVVPIGSLITEFRGGAPLKPSDFTGSGVKVLPKGGVGRSGWLRIENSDLQYCSPEYAMAHPRNQVDETFTIVVLRDLVPSGPSIGLMVQIRDKEPFVLAQGVYGFKVTQMAVPGYLVQLSNTWWYRKLMNSIMVGSTQVHITNTAFKRAQIPLPSLPEQEAIAAILSDMDAEIAALEEKLAKARQIKQGMMQELLTGRIRLR